MDRREKFRVILKWTLIGLLIRFLIMPFSFHGSDIFFIYRFPFKFIAQGMWNPYLFLKVNFPHAYSYYYAPVIFLTMSFFLIFFRPFLPYLNNLFSEHASWSFFAGDANTVHYADILMKHQLFRTLFLFKVPYLFFDFGTGLLLLKILKVEEKKKLLAYKLWMLNPFVLHSCYALGQMDVIPTFLLTAAIYYIHLKRKYWAMILLSLATMAKFFPVILIPVSVLLLGYTFRDRLKLSLVFIVAIFSLVLPFCFPSAGAAIMSQIFLVPSNMASFRPVLFVISYLIVMSFLFFIKREAQANLDFIILTFISILLLFFSFYIVTIRYFILITPLLIYTAIKNKKFWFYNLIFLITLFVLRTSGNSQQWGLFAALHPEFFSGLPILDSYLNLIINVKYIHQFMYRLFVISSLIMVIHIFIINRKLFKFRVVFSKKRNE